MRRLDPVSYLRIHPSAHQSNYLVEGLLRVKVVIYLAKSCQNSGGRITGVWGQENLNTEIKGIIFDIDGCLIYGDRAIPGAVEQIANLRRRGFRMCFFTNGNMDPTERWAEMLTRLGFEVRGSEVLTSLMVAADYVAERFPKSRVLPVGSQTMRSVLVARGIEVVDWADAADAQVVLMGRDPDFSQRKLEMVCSAIWRGARFIVTNLDRSLPFGDGFIPETGPMVKAVEWATRCRPLVVGKPSPVAGRAALRLLTLPAENALVVGDNVQQDVRMGKTLGMKTALVLTGCTPAADVPNLPPQLKPDVVLSDVTHLARWLDTRCGEVTE